MKDILNKYAALEYQKMSTGKENYTGKKKLKDSKLNSPASKYDVAEAVFYMMDQLAEVIQPASAASKARYDLIVRALEKNRVLSKDVLKSIKEQLKVINSEANNKDKDKDVD